MDTLTDLIADWGKCRVCQIGCFANKHVWYDSVQSPDSDRPRCDVLFIGEGPGKGEDALGRPFVGRAGKLLRSTIERADRDALICGFTNLVACRPTDQRGGANRAPSTLEVNNCSGRLVRTIRLVQPYVIVCLGNVAQEHVPAILATSRIDATICHIKHPSAVLRVGGESATYYQEYVGKFRRVFETCRVLKGVIRAPVDAVGLRTR